jgi:acyl-CoA synthetase (AMP-forming)/AMP-acid ligase II
MNIVDPILFQCRMNPHGPAICTPGTSADTISYGRLGRMIDNVGRKALGHGLAPGNVAALAIKNKILHAGVILGLARLGIATVSGRDQPLPKELRADAIITDGVHHFGTVARVITADASWDAGDGRPLDGSQAPRAGGNGLCRIVLTSGTTGEPKAVAFTHKMLCDRVAHYGFAKGNRFPRISRLYCDLGIGSSPGFRYLLYMLWKGGTIYFYGDDAQSAVQAFDLHKIQGMVASPHGLGEYLKFFETHSAFQCGFDHVMSSGGSLTPHLAERIRARMSPNVSCSYGSTEAGTIAFGPADLIASVPGAVGFLTPGAAVEFVGETGGALPAGKEGALRVRSPNLVDGYLGDPTQSAASFRDGWFYPGDFGRLTKDGILVITGREQTRLNIGGDKANPETIEDVIGGFAGIEQAAAFSVPNELGIEEVVALIVARSKIDQAALRSHCAARLPSAFVPVRYIQVAAIPRSEMGKIERQRLPGLAKMGLHKP